MKVLISGGSIAGLSAAYFLASSGHQVTLVERAPGVRRGGVAVDVRAEALDHARDMGIFDDLERDRVTTDDVFNFVDSQGRVAASLRVAEQFYDSPQDIEISRDALCRILERRLPAGVETRFDTAIEDATETSDSVQVRLSDGSALEVDLLVGADGMHSTVRRVFFGPEAEYLRHLGLYVGILKCCRSAPVAAGTYVYNTPNTMLMTRGDGVDSSALLGFRSPWLHYDYRNLDAQKALVRQAFSVEDGWLVPALVSEIPDAEDFYFDSVSQIRMTRWFSSRTVLVGDAGYCPSFFSGMGTSLAITGAATLASALDAAKEDLGLALAAYDRRMRPIVDKAQQLASEGTALLFPASKSDIQERNEQVRAMAADGTRRA